MNKPKSTLLDNGSAEEELDKCSTIRIKIKKQTAKVVTVAPIKLKIAMLHSFMLSSFSCGAFGDTHLLTSLFRSNLSPSAICTIEFKIEIEIETLIACFFLLIDSQFANILSLSLPLCHRLRTMWNSNYSTSIHVTLFSIPERTLPSPNRIDIPSVFFLWLEGFSFLTLFS